MRHLVGLLAALAIAGAGVAPAAAQPEPRNESATQPPAVGDPALAIVPFVNLSGEPSDDWIGDGIVETTVAGLEQLDTVSILESAALFAAVTEELQAYGQDVPSDPERILRDVSRRLGAAWILTGSYERTDGALRFTARIVDVDTGTVATGVAVDGGAGEIFDLQDRLVAEVAAALGRLQRNGFAPTAGEPRPGARPSDLGAGSRNGDRFGYRGGFGNGPVPGAANGRGGNGNGNGNGYGNGNGNGDGPLGLATRPAAVIVPPPAPAERPARPASAPRDPVPGRPAPTDVTGELAFGGAPTSAGFGVARDVGILTGRPTARPPRVRERPRIDGRLDDAIWREALHITEFVQQNPVEGAPATESTDIWIAYDSQNFYVAVHAHYEDRSLMRANRVDRDQTIDDDNIAVYFDTFLDQQRAYRFSVNGYGVQGDAIVNSRGWSMGGRRRRTGSYSWSGSRIPTGDSSWDALFSSGGRIVDDGFTAEMAIPFKSLRYPQRDRDIPHRWGFQIVREVRGKDENQVWAPITRNVSGFLTQVGVLEGMTNLSMSRNIEVLPTFTAIQHGSLYGATFATKDVAPEGGLNVKYGITSNLTADLTYNPDFSQIESDLPQIEVNQRFALRYPELRPFFLEGAEIFQMFGPVTFVHTRTIVDPEFGAKLTGKVGDTTLGLIVANDEAPGRVAPGDEAYGQKANNLVARARYDLYAESHVGAFFTHRSFMDSHSTLGAVDGDFRLGNTQGFGFKAVQTDHRDLDGIQRQGQMFDMNYRLNSRHWSGWVSAYSLSPDFRHDVGFVRRTDMQQVFSRIGYTVWPESWVLNWGPSIGYSRNHSFDGLLQDEDWRAGFNATFARNISMNVELRDEMEHYLGIDFHKRAVSIGGQVNTSRRLSFGGYYRRGDEVKYQENPYLGQGGSGSFFASVRPASRFQSELNLSVSDFIDLRSGGAEPIFDVKILRALSTYQFTDRLLLRNISEYNTFDRKFALNWLFTYRVDAGTAFYVGYDDHYQQADRLYGDINGDGLDEQLFPTLLTMQRTNRAIFTKIQYLFRY